MNKKIVICADGTWNRPEKNLKQDSPTNVLKLARAVKPVGNDEISQQVFYDWGVGSYYDAALIQKAFNHYKRNGKAFAPEGEKSKAFRKRYAHESREDMLIRPALERESLVQECRV